MNTAYICLDKDKHEVTPCTPVGECHKAGDFLSDAKNCSIYYECFDGLKNLGKFVCDTGLLIDITRKICDWPTNVHCTT